MNRIVEKMARLQAGLAGVMLVLGLVLTAFQLVSGYLGKGAALAGRAALCAMIWSVFLESGVLVYEKSHFSVMILADKIRSRRVRALWDLLASMTKLLFSVLLIYYGILLGWPPAPGSRMEFLGMGFLWLSLPICGFTSSIYLLNHVISDIRQIRAIESGTEGRRESECSQGGEQMGGGRLI